MSAQELQVVKAFSSISVPEDVIRNSDIKGIVQDILSENEAVDANSRRLQRLRREKAEGNFFGNLWHNRSDKVDDAQSDLNTSIGKLTQKSSQLLVVNTAISKVLSDQQGVLLQQQRLLEKQTEKLKKQNDKILEQQLILEQQQEALNKANQGLLEAKGLTQEQALRLVGCVKRVEDSESKLETANQLLRSQIDEQLNNSYQYVGSVVEKLETDQEVTKETLNQQVVKYIEVTDNKLAAANNQLCSHVDEQLNNSYQYFESVIAKLEASQGEAKKELHQKVTECSEVADSKLKQQKSEMEKFQEKQRQKLLEQDSQLKDLVSTIEKKLITKTDDLQQEFVEKNDQFKSQLNKQHADFKIAIEGLHTKMNGKLALLTHDLDQLKNEFTDLDSNQKAILEKMGIFKKQAVWGGGVIGLLSISSIAWHILLHFALIP